MDTMISEAISVIPSLKRSVGAAPVWRNQRDHVVPYGFWNMADAIDKKFYWRPAGSMEPAGIETHVLALRD